MIDHKYWKPAICNLDKKKCVAWLQVNFIWTFSKYKAFAQKILLWNWKTYQCCLGLKIKTCSDCDTNQNDFKLTLSSLQILQEIIIST
jgi:hypothetical protein